MQTNIFCSRKGGATIGKRYGKGVFYRHPTTSEFLAKEAKRKADKQEIKRRRASANVRD